MSLITFLVSELFSEIPSMQAPHHSLSTITHVYHPSHIVLLQVYHDHHCNQLGQRRT